MFSSVPAKHIFFNTHVPLSKDGWTANRDGCFWMIIFLNKIYILPLLLLPMSSILLENFSIMSDTLWRLCRFLGMSFSAF